MNIYMDLFHADFSFILDIFFVAQTQRRIAADKRALTIVGARFVFLPRWDIVHFGRVCDLEQNALRVFLLSLHQYPALKRTSML